MNERDLIRLHHMLDASREAIEFIQGQTRADLDSNRMLALAEVRLIEIIGEAARHVPAEIRDKYPEVEWKEIIGSRDRMIHGYYRVDHDIVWSILSHDLPILIPLLEKIIASESL